MSTDIRKHTSIAAGEKPTRAALAASILSVSDIVPVANGTEANQIATALVAAGQTLANTPLTVRRADAPGMHTLEVTKDGTNWAPASGVGHFSTTGARDTWTTTNSALLVAGDTCVAANVTYRWDGSLWYIPVAGATVSSSTNSSGVVTVTHGIGKTPISVQVTMAADGPVVPSHLKPQVSNFTSTTFDVLVLRNDTSDSAFGSNPVKFYWAAFT